jgi:hypothetical protein
VNDTVYIIGSEDMGTTCTDTDSVCISASDADTEVNCTAAVQALELPALGRVAGESWGASMYPGGSDNSVVLAAGNVTDDVTFGPTLASQVLP